MATMRRSFFTSPSSPSARQPASSASLPAPTAGWVTNVNKGQMTEVMAYDLHNFIPRANQVELRRGYSEHATGVADSVETLVSYSGGNIQKLLACGDGKIYDASSSGAVGVALGSGYGSNQWQSVNFGTGGAYYAMLVNGADSPKAFDGTVISTPTITGSGLTTSNLINVNAFKGRLFYVEKNTLSFWYGGLNEYQGTVNEFDLAPFSRRGGYLVATGSWTRDSGAGVDDYFVAMTSEGEILLYSGSDPADANDWSLVGSYDLAPPIGYRCFQKFGSDMVVLTKIGILPLSSIQTRDSANIAESAVSRNIEGTFRRTVASYGASFGWQIITYPRQGYMLVNIPTVLGTAIQYIVSVQTGGWARFSGMSGSCWATHNDDLYFGAYDGSVYKADDTSADNDTNINWDIRTAFSYFGDRSRSKKYNMVRPVWNVTGNISYGYSVSVDFGDARPSYTSTIGVTGTPWGSPWGSPWSPSNIISQVWSTVTAYGRCASLWLSGATKNVETLALQSIDWEMEQGDIL